MRRSDKFNGNQSDATPPIIMENVLQGEFLDTCPWHGFERRVRKERIFQRIIISRKGDGSNTVWLLCFFHFVYDFKVPTRYRVVIHLVQVIQWKNERTLVKRKG